MEWNDKRGQKMKQESGMMAMAIGMILFSTSCMLLEKQEIPVTAYPEAERELPAQASIAAGTEQDMEGTKQYAEDGTLTYWQGENLTGPLENDPEFLQLQQENADGGIAMAFVRHYADQLKLKNPADELRLSSVQTDELGMTHVRVRQRYEGIPVWGAEMIVHLNPANQVYLMEGQYIPTPTEIETEPALTPLDAMNRAALHLGKGTCTGCETELMIYPESPGRGPCLAYRVRIRPSLTEGWNYFIDARTGGILNRYSTVQTSNSQPSIPPIE